MDKVNIDAAMQHCCDRINRALDIPGNQRGQARYIVGGISVDYELRSSRASVSLHVEPNHSRETITGLTGRVRIHANASHLELDAASEFIRLYQSVLALGRQIQAYLDSILLNVD